MPRRTLQVCFVCSGNTCRSPMGEVVLDTMAAGAGGHDWLAVTSAGTADWHIGEQADARTVAVLAARGYDGSRHRARLFEPGWFDRLDLVVALDRSHERTLRSWAPDDRARSTIRLLRRFDPATAGEASSALDVPDPYYSGVEDFEHTLDLVEAACAGLLEHLRSRPPSAAPEPDAVRPTP